MKKLSGNTVVIRYYSAVKFKSSENFICEVKEIFKDIIIYDIAEEYDDDNPFRDLQIADNFLHGGGQTYSVDRVIVRLYGFVMLSYIHDCSVLAISFHDYYKNTMLDRLIHNRQLGALREWKTIDGISSIAEICDVICEKLRIVNSLYNDCVLLEIINTDKEYNSVDDFELNEKKEIFGLLTGDEGYCYVPDSMVKSTISYKWGSRKYIRLYAYENSFVFIHLTGSSVRKKYIMREEEYGISIGAHVNNYFYLEDCPLIANHGIFFSIEFVMILKTLLSSVVRTSLKITSQGSFYKRIQEIKSKRRQIVEVLQKADEAEIAEFGKLGIILQQSQNIAPIVEKVSDMLELLEGELELLYSERNNVLITVLTIIGILIAFFQLLMGS